VFSYFGSYSAIFAQSAQLTLPSLVNLPTSTRERPKAARINDSQVVNTVGQNIQIQDFLSGNIGADGATFEFILAQYDGISGIQNTIYDGKGGADSSTKKGVAIWYEPSNDRYCYEVVNTSNTQLIINTAGDYLGDGSVRYLVATLQGSAMRFYVNGVLVATSDSAPTGNVPWRSSSRVLLFCRDVVTYNSAKVDCSYCCIRPYAITQDQVSALYLRHLRGKAV
jgi:hypothetical protein